AVSVVPDRPMMNALLMPRNSPRPPKGSRNPQLFPLDGVPPSRPLRDEALTACALVIHAELDGLVAAREGAGHGAIDRALVAAEFGAFDQRAVRPQRIRELLLQRAVGGLSIGFGLLRRHLHQETTFGRRSGVVRRRCGLGRRSRRYASARLGRRRRQ